MYIRLSIVCISVSPIYHSTLHCNSQSDRKHIRKAFMDIFKEYFGKSISGNQSLHTTVQPKSWHLILQKASIPEWGPNSHCKDPITNDLKYLDIYHVWTNLIAWIVILAKGTCCKGVSPVILDGRISQIFYCPFDSQVASLTWGPKSE